MKKSRSVQKRIGPVLWKTHRKTFSGNSLNKSKHIVLNNYCMPVSNADLSLKSWPMSDVIL